MVVLSRRQGMCRVFFVAGESSICSCWSRGGTGMSTDSGMLT
jgi:hypothetical protein